MRPEASTGLVWVPFTWGASMHARKQASTHAHFCKTDGHSLTFSPTFPPSRPPTPPSQVRTIVRKTVLALLQTDKYSRLVVTGHSMGAAMATLCVKDLERYLIANRKKTLLSPRLRVSAYTYGSCACGGVIFKHDYDNRVPDTWRFVNGNDVIVYSSQRFGYTQVGHLCYMNEVPLFLRVTLQLGTASIVRLLSDAKC